MNEPYADLIAQNNDAPQPTYIPILQLLFIIYLVLGQLVLLLSWRGLTPRDWANSRAGSLLFAAYLIAGQVALLVGWPVLMNAWLAADAVARADAIIVLHLGFVVAVLLSFFLVLIGWWRGWSWTRNFWFRAAHLLAIEIVAGQAVVGLDCPLMTLEQHLRGGWGFLHPKEGEASAIGRFCNQTLYMTGMDSRAKAFVYIYGGVALLFAMTWVLAPPRVPWARSPAEQGA